jgi:prepilin-type N-terminal cleavage/methylation domain-containing protein
MMMFPDRIRGPLGAQDGFSIVELLVAVVILVFVSIALLQTAVVNIEFNAKNAIRDEGVRLAGDMLDTMRNAALGNVVADYNGKTNNVDRRVRNMTVRYTVQTAVEDVGSANKKLSTTVSWAWKGETFDTQMYTVR